MFFCKENISFFDLLICCWLCLKYCFKSGSISEVRGERFFLVLDDSTSFLLFFMLTTLMKSIMLTTRLRLRTSTSWIPFNSSVRNFSVQTCRLTVHTFGNLFSSRLHFICLNPFWRFDISCSYLFGKHSIHLLIIQFTSYAHTFSKAQFL